MSENLTAALDRLSTLAEGVGRRLVVIGSLTGIAGVLAWGILLRRVAFDSVGAFLAWSPLLVALSLPGFVLHRFGRRVASLGPAVEEIATKADDVVSEARSDIAHETRSITPGGIRGVLGSLRELGRHGEAVRDLVSDAVGTASIVTVPYLATVGLAIACSGIVFTLLLVAGVTLAV